MFNMRSETRYYFYWNCLIHSFTAFLIDYLFLGIFSNVETSFSYEIMTQNIVFNNFSIIYILLIILFIAIIIFSLLYLFSNFPKIVFVFPSWLARV